MLEQLKLLVEAGKAVGNWGKGAYDVVKPAVQWVQVGWGLLSGTGSAASGVAMNDGEVEKQKGAKAKTENEIAEAEAKKAARGPVRKAFDKIIDVLFAPSFLRIISFISLAGLAFSPFGPIAIAIAATVSVSCMVYGVINEGKTLKNLKVQQNEGKAVEELMEMRKGQLEILANNPNLAAVLMEDISAHTTDPKKKDVPDKVVKIKNVMEGMPEMLVPFLGNVMSGNPILMGVGLFTLLTSTVANTSEQLSFSDQRDKMMDIMKQNQALLGIEFPIGKGGDFLKEQWLVLQTH